MFILILFGGSSCDGSKDILMAYGVASLSRCILVVIGNDEIVSLIKLGMKIALMTETILFFS